jgi:2,4-dienoyl-CoA reductase-like NADH-dependent reductase (Old Yellow Enzyme family)
MAQDLLFSQLRIGSLTVDGRFGKAATSETRADGDGYITDELLAFYDPIVRAGTPLVITGNLYVCKQGKSTPRQCGIDDDDKLAGLRRWTALAHAHGSRLIAQLNHSGRQTIPHAVGLAEAVSASDVTEKIMGTTPRPLERAEIAQTIDAFTDAAARAERAGFDGVQLHMGHGYLINQFLTPYTNRRRDDYGGPLANRMRFAREVLAAVRRRVGRDYPVLAKLNGADLLYGRRGATTDEFIAVAQALASDGLDAVEITVGHYESGMPMMRGNFDAFFSALGKEGAAKNAPVARRLGLRVAAPLLATACNLLWPKKEGFNAPYARRFRRALTIPVLCVGGFHTRRAMEEALGRGDCDGITVGRAMIANPWLARDLRLGGDGLSGPVCRYTNGCIARAGNLPVDCYDAEVRAQRELVDLQEESHA